MAKWNAPTDVSTGGFLAKPGWYHFVCTGVDEEPSSASGQMLEGWRVDAKVLDGTDKTEIGRDTEIMLWHPKLTDKNEGEFAIKKQARFLLSTCVISQEDLGRQDMDIDLDKAVGRQFVAKMESETSNQGKEFIRLSFAELYHVDDAKVKDVPKEAEALAKIPPQLRMVGGRPVQPAGNALSQPEVKPVRQQEESQASVLDVI